MTSIRDISNNLTKVYYDYHMSQREMNNLYNEFWRIRNKLLLTDSNPKSILLYENAVKYLKAQDQTAELKRKWDRAHYMTGSHIPSVKLSAKKLRSLHPEMCGVCMEYHTYRTMITTSCRHHFGKECFSNWIDTCFVNYKDVSCALCRDTRFTITRYSSKKHII